MIRKLFPKIFCILAVMLLAFSAAAAESTRNTWEERLAEARLKYNKDTVNIILGWRNQMSRVKINVRFYKSDGQPQMYIMIYESLKITDEAEMQAILEVIAQSEYYSEEIYGSVSLMKAQWIAHNLAYELATGSAEERDLAVAIAGENLSMIIKRSKELDLSPIAYMSAEEKTLYELVELLYSLNGT